MQDSLFDQWPRSPIDPLGGFVPSVYDEDYIGQNDAKSPWPADAGSEGALHAPDILHRVAGPPTPNPNKL